MPPLRRARPAYAAVAPSLARRCKAAARALRLSWVFCFFFNESLGWMSEGAQRKCLDLRRPVLNYGPGVGRIWSLKQNPPRRDCTRPNSCRRPSARMTATPAPLPPYTNMCTPLYWTSFFRRRFLRHAGMRRKPIASFHQKEIGGKAADGTAAGSSGPCRDK